MAPKRSRGRPPYPDVLTPAEWRVVEAARHGLPNAEIARRQNVSADAVEFHLANAVGKLGLADRTALRRWPGIRRDSNLHRKAPDMDTVQLGPIGQIARSVKDIAEAERWYRDVLGLTHLYTFGKLAFFDCGGVRLYLQEGEEPSHSVIYFRVPDIRTAHTQMMERSIEFPHPPHLIHRHADGTEEWMAFFNDNEGRPLAIMSQVKAG
jgi:DNA-binding CsgD family transcriptional regulator/catechol 2,3-dioxygenase-like lactoylglutathione lyase family enzyme